MKIYFHCLSRFLLISIFLSVILACSPVSAPVRVTIYIPTASVSASISTNDNISTPSPPISGTLVPLSVTYDVVNAKCDSSGQIVTVNFVVLVSGGVSPYGLRLIDSTGNERELDQVDLNLSAGESTQIKVYSTDGQTWTGIISVPTSTLCKPSPNNSDLPVSTLDFVPLPSSTAIRGPCNDGIDNDGDGLIDFPYDPQCENIDGQEIPVTQTPVSPLSSRQCNDGIDNDGDGKIDYPDDPDCKNNADPKE